MSHLLDSQFEGPFGLRFGIDPLIGLIPFIGSLFTRVISLYIVVQGVRLSGASLWVTAQMFLNIFIEFVFESIPVLGLFFDFVYKANNRNIQLIERFLEQPQTTRRLIQVNFFLLILFAISFFVLMAYVAYLGLSFMASFM